jgi:rubrerythrin
MDRSDIEKRIERYEQLLQAAKDEAERRVIRQLLEEERAKLRKANDQ